jgi:hypothetical protein
MKSSLQDAQSAVKSLGHALGHPNGRHADTIADAFSALSDRLNAIEQIVAELAKRNGLSGDDIVPNPPQGLRVLTGTQMEILRILR